MRNKLLFTLLWAINVAVVLAFSSCAKEPPPKTIDTTTDYSIINNYTQDLFTQIHTVVQRYPSGGNNKFGCASSEASTPVDTAYPNTIVTTFDFDCTSGPTRRRRTGEITVIMNGDPFTPLTVIEFSTKDYKINNHTITANGTLTTSNEVSSDGINQFDFKITSGTIELDGKQLTWTTDLTYEFVEGKSTTGTVKDDVFLISGSIKGADRDDNSFESGIDKKLVKKLYCEWITEGAASVIPVIDGTPAFPRIVDFGNGGCDTDAFITIGFDTFSLTLPE